MQEQNPDILYTQITALATVATVVATVFMVFFQIKFSKKSTMVQLSLQLTEKYDDRQMRDHRKKLADVLLSGSTRPTPTQMEAVIDHLETVPNLTHRGWLDKEIVHNSFSVSIRHWWAALEKDINNMRQEYHDASMYDEFEKLAQTYNNENKKRLSPPIGQQALKIFLESESK
jgi:Domain of unknown function (DUF4760)